MDSRMLEIDRKFSDFPSKRFKLVGYCSHCQTRFKFNQDLHPEVKLRDVQQKLACPKCDRIQLCVTVLLNKAGSADQQHSAA